MSTLERTVITVENTINAPVQKVWEFWSNPEHIIKWCSPSEDWHTPKAENDLRTGGKFLSHMEAKDKSFGFDFGGVYTKVEEYKRIEYTMSDGREVQVIFSEEGNGIKLVETFDAENTHPVEMQQAGWQAILDNFKKYTEAN